MYKMTYRQKIFCRYILSYSIILLLPIIFMVGIGTNFLSDKRQEEYSLSEQAFQQSMTNIESRFEEINNLTQLIATNKNLINSINESDYYTKYRLYKDLNQYCYTNSFIQSIYVFFEQDDSVVGSDGIITSKEVFYRIKYDQGYEHYQEWLEKEWDWQNYVGHLDTDEVRTTFSGTERVIQYAWPVESGAGKNRKSARIYIYITEQNLCSLISHISTLESFSIRTPESGNTISLDSDSVNQNDNPDNYIMLNSVAASGREYSCTLLRDNVLKEWYNQLFFNVLLMLFACILCGICSFFLAKRNSVPIANIFDLVHKDSDSYSFKKQDVLDYVQDRVSDILQDQQLLEAELERRIPLLQVSFIERILSGTLPDYSDLEGQLDNLHISLHGEYYCVAILQLLSYPEESESTDYKPLASARLIIERIIYMNRERDLYVYSMDGDLVTVILTMSENQLADNYPEMFCRQIAEKTLSEQNITVSYAIGRSYEALADVFLSYMQAKKLLKDKEVSLTPNHNDFVCFYYPLELEQKLLRVTLSGNEETVTQIFNELQQENLRSRQLSVSMYQRLLEELLGTFVKVLGLMRESQYLTSALEEVLEVPSLFDAQQDSIEMFHSLFLEAAGIVRTGKEGKAEDYKNQIISYMKESYTDPSMSLSMLAEHFHVTEVYMSKLFKKHIGTTFSQYLEDLRMQHAKELLRSSRASIGNIAESCGYQSPHAFRRAYKRYYGDLPSDTRK